MQRREVRAGLDGVDHQALQGTPGERLEALSSKVDANDASVRLLRERVEFNHAAVMDMLQELQGAIQMRSKRRAQRLPSVDGADDDDAALQGGRAQSRSRRRANYGVLSRMGEPGLPAANAIDGAIERMHASPAGEQWQPPTRAHTERPSNNGGTSAFLSTGSMATVSGQMSPSDERDELRAVPSEPSFSSPFDA